jgi:DNA-binding SARP family transcriptional activator
MSDLLQLQLFGPGRAKYHDRPFAGFPNQQAYHLFCYLILNRHQPHNRERLAAVFWSDYPTPISRKYLRDALWRLRQGFQNVGADHSAFLSIDDASVAFVNSSPYWLDIESFEHAIRKYEDKPGHALSAEESEQLEGAVNLYVGELLEGAYQDWCIHDRERLNLLYFNALAKLMTYHEAYGSYERGITFGERILHDDATREKVHRQMMRLFWLSGNRSAALAQYKRCSQALREMLGIPPMEETRLLYEQMLHDEFHPVLPKPGTRRVLRPDGYDQSEQLTIDQALQKLRRLQAMVSETNAELQRLEALIRTALDRTDDRTPYDK